MKISVVTPAFNASSTIMSSIRSVLDQSHGEWEHIIVDDGSMDDTARLASSMKDVRIRLFRQPHGGVCSARNRGVAEANGEVVTFLDADDVADRDWLATFADAFDRRPGLGLVCCGARVVADGVTNGEMLPEASGGLLRDHRGLFLSGTYALRRSLLVRAGPFDERLRIGENTDLGFRVVAALLSLRMPSACIDRPLITWRRDVRRTDRRDLDRLESAEHTMAKYTRELEAMPEAAAALERIAAVNAARLGYAGRARRHAARAVSLRPSEVTSWTTAAGCFVPGLDRRWSRPSPTPAGRRTGQRRPASPSPRVSVLLPVFNGGERTGRAVDSIFNQTFTDLELVVIDDGSTDQTAAELSARASDARLRVIRHEENRGLVASLNHGLSRCHGELIARLDADDWAFPTRLARQVAEFDSHPDLVLCGSPYERLDDNGRLLRTGAPPRTHAELALAMLIGNRVLHSTAMYRRDLALRIGGYDRAWFPVEDYDFWLRLLEVGEFRALETPEIRYTVNPDGISARHSGDQGDKSLIRSQKYLHDLVDTSSHQRKPEPLTARDVACAARSLRRRLPRRGISRGGLDRQALLVANSLLRDFGRLRRAMTILVMSPRIAILGRLDYRAAHGR